MSSFSLYNFDAAGVWGQYVKYIYSNWMIQHKGLRPVLENKQHWSFCVADERKVHLDEEETGIFRCSVGLMHEHCHTVFWDTLYDLYQKKDTDCAENNVETYEKNIMQHWLTCKPEEYTASATTAIIDGKERASVIVVASTSAGPQNNPASSENVETVDLTDATSDVEEDSKMTSWTEDIEDISSESSNGEESEENISEIESIEELLQASYGTEVCGVIDFETPMPGGEEDEHPELEKVLESENYFPYIPSKEKI